MRSRSRSCSPRADPGRTLGLRALARRWPSWSSGCWGRWRSGPPAATSSRCRRHQPQRAGRPRRDRTGRAHPAGRVRPAPVEAVAGGKDRRAAVRVGSGECRRVGGALRRSAAGAVTARGADRVAAATGAGVVRERARRRSSGRVGDRGRCRRTDDLLLVVPAVTAGAGPDVPAGHAAPRHRDHARCGGRAGRRTGAGRAADDRRAGREPSADRDRAGSLGAARPAARLRAGVVRAG